MKKILAPGCETPTIAKLMAAARPFAYGMCMAGAGGGGFLYVLTKDTNHKHLLIDILDTVEVIVYNYCWVFFLGQYNVRNYSIDLLFPWLRNAQLFRFYDLPVPNG